MTRDEIKRFVKNFEAWANATMRIGQLATVQTEEQANKRLVARLKELQALSVLSDTEWNELRMLENILR